MRYLTKFFWRHSLGVGTLVPNVSEFLVCLSVCQLADYLTEITQILGYLQFRLKYLFENFLWRHYWDVGTFVPINSDFFLYVSHSGIQISILLKLYRYWDIFSSGQDITPKIFWRYSWGVSIVDPNNFEYCVRLSVCQVVYFLTNIRQMK